MISRQFAGQNPLANELLAADLAASSGDDTLVAQVPTSLMGALRSMGLGGIGDWERSGNNSLSDFARRQQRQERAVDRAVQLENSSYRGRKNSNLQGPGPDYQGPTLDVGGGTGDRMPGTTPTWTPRSSRPYAGPPRPTPASVRTRNPADFI